MSSPKVEELSKETEVFQGIRDGTQGRFGFLGFHEIAQLIASQALGPPN
jgi:hypothetical protein